MPPTKPRKPVEPKKCGHNWVWIVLYMVIVLAIILGGTKIALVQYNYDKAMDDGTYQAVFLTNGQVYFGQLESLGFGTMQLKDVYYLQVSEDEEAEAEAEAANQNFTLVKLGDELHGPTSDMVINKKQILFWENLRQDSPVLETIQGGGQ
ncbi:hypothetical protein KKC88_02755 [Patescibacteria group bacterium]|nr:hypothetical protein [Patescibacteria group bacterium]MBU1672891.1 hypothetical protein [Patescibacteria group bacterium]MBU1963142.1 hypothetical protein [Patescibacteria group bacterium]